MRGLADSLAKMAVELGVAVRRPIGALVRYALVVSGMERVGRFSPVHLHSMIVQFGML